MTMALELDPGFGFEELSDDELLAVDGGLTAREIAVLIAAGFLGGCTAANSIPGNPYVNFVLGFAAGVIVASDVKK